MRTTSGLEANFENGDSVPINSWPLNPSADTWYRTSRGGSQYHIKTVHDAYVSQDFESLDAFGIRRDENVFAFGHFVGAGGSSATTGISKALLYDSLKSGSSLVALDGAKELGSPASDFEKFRDFSNLHSQYTDLASLRVAAGARRTLYDGSSECPPDDGTAIVIGCTSTPYPIPPGIPGGDLGGGYYSGGGSYGPPFKAGTYYHDCIVDGIEEAAGVTVAVATKLFAPILQFARGNPQAFARIFAGAAAGGEISIAALAAAFGEVAIALAAAIGVAALIEAAYQVGVACFS